MTTILADAKLGIMVSDSNVTDGDRAWSRPKVFRIRGTLVGLAGETSNFEPFLKWYRGGMDGPADFQFESSVLVLTPKGLFNLECDGVALERIHSGIEAIGSGGYGAICAYEAMRFQDPVKAVRIACKHDAGSRAPIRTYRLKSPETK